MIRAFAALLATTITASAQDAPCGDYTAIEAELSAKWQENPVARGLDPNGRMVVVFADTEGDTWTILVVSPDGSACAVAGGTDWQSADQKPPGVDG